MLLHKVITCRISLVSVKNTNSKETVLSLAEAVFFSTETGYKKGKCMHPDLKKSFIDQQKTIIATSKPF